MMYGQKNIKLQKGTFLPNFRSVLSWWTVSRYFVYHCTCLPT